MKHEVIHSTDNTYLTHESQAEITNCVTRDLNAAVSSFESASAAKRTFLQTTGISNASYYRYVKGDFGRIHAKHLEKIYEFITGEKLEGKLLDKVPACVEEVLSASLPCSLEEYKETRAQDLSQDMESNPAFIEIYWGTVEGNIVDANYILQEYGRHGMDTLKSMEIRGIIQAIPNQKNKYTEGPRRSTTPSFSATKQVMGHLHNKHCRTKPIPQLDVGNRFNLRVGRMTKEEYYEFLSKMEKHIEESNQTFADSRGDGKYLVYYQASADIVFTDKSSEVLQ